MTPVVVEPPAVTEAVNSVEHSTVTTEMVSLDSAVLGAIAVPATAVFQFADGMHGFPGHTRFALVPSQREGLFWLQSLADRTVTFLVVDPFSLRADYSVDLGVTEKRALDVADANDVLLLAIVTLPGSNGDSATANLRGPVVLNVRTRLGRQVVTTDDRHAMHAPVDILSLPVRA